jgi:hypothetical protein
MAGNFSVTQYARRNGLAGITRRVAAVLRASHYIYYMQGTYRFAIAAVRFVMT